MAKPKAVTPNVLIKAWVHPELKAKMALLLVSEVEGRIPLGKISSFISERIREYFDWAKLDLGLYGFGQGYFVSGPKPMIEALEARLKGGGNAVS